MKRTLIRLALCLLAAPALAQARDLDKANCTYKGIQKVQIVNAFPDIKIEVVNAFEDIRVERVRAFASSCGKWEIVTAFPDFKVQIVRAFGDIKVSWVTAFPGMR